ncbi:unnamed protein product, partial [Choristocarpus tenellus]
MLPIALAAANWLGAAVVVVYLRRLEKSRGSTEIHPYLRLVRPENGKERTQDARSREGLPVWDQAVKPDGSDSTVANNVEWESDLPTSNWRTWTVSKSVGSVELGSRAKNNPPRPYKSALSVTPLQLRNRNGDSGLSTEDDSSTEEAELNGRTTNSRQRLRNQEAVVSARPARNRRAQELEPASPAIVGNFPEVEGLLRVVPSWLEWVEGLVILVLLLRLGGTMWKVTLNFIRGGHPKATDGVEEDGAGGAEQEEHALVRNEVEDRDVDQGLEQEAVGRGAVLDAEGTTIACGGGSVGNGAGREGFSEEALAADVG